MLLALFMFFASVLLTPLHKPIVLLRLLLFVPARSDPALSVPTLSDPALSDPARSSLARSDPARSDPALSDPTLSVPVLSDPTLSDPALLFLLFLILLFLILLFLFLFVHSYPSLLLLDFPLRTISVAYSSGGYQNIYGTSKVSRIVRIIKD